MCDILWRLKSPTLSKQQYLSSLNEFSRLCRSNERNKSQDEEEAQNCFFDYNSNSDPNNVGLNGHHQQEQKNPGHEGQGSIISLLDSVAISHAKEKFKDRNPLFLLNRNEEKDFFTMDDVFSCLKSALFHEAAEVRAAALRAIRYLLRDEISVKSLLRVNLPIFIVRSIDIVLENRTERIQALRLVRKFLSISPHLFPIAFTRSLIAIAQDGQSEHDTLTRACWALLAELSIMSPISSTTETQNCAFYAIMDATLTGNQSHGMCESLISTLLYMLNWPAYRCLIRGDLDLQIFVAPFTDSHYTAPISKDHKHGINQVAKFDVDPYDQRENKFTAAKITLISILRSWPGLIYLCEPQFKERNLVSNSCLKSLVNMLYLPYNDVRRRLIDLIFELLYLPLPDSTPDFDTGLKFLEKYQLSKDSWKIHDAFIVDEAKALLPPLRSRPRMNLVNDYMALLLVALFNCNVIDALSEVIITPSNQENSIRATILIYQLLSFSYQYLPTDSFSQYLTLSTLISHATSKNEDSRDLANAALINLGRVQPFNKSQYGNNYIKTRYSVFLAQILEFCSPHLLTAPQDGLSNGSGSGTETQNLNCLLTQMPATPLTSSATSSSISTTSSSALVAPTTIASGSTSGSEFESTPYSNHNTNNTTNSQINSIPITAKSNTLSTTISQSRASNSSSSSVSTIVNLKPKSRSSSISSKSPSMLSRSPSISTAVSLLTLFSFSSSNSKSNLRSMTEQNWQTWDWEYIDFILTRPCENMKRFSSQHYRSFIRKLVQFYKPSSNQYSLIDINSDWSRQLCVTGSKMIDFLVESPETKATELLKELLHDISFSMHDPESYNINQQQSNHNNNHILPHHHRHHHRHHQSNNIDIDSNSNNVNAANHSAATSTAHRISNVTPITVIPKSPPQPDVNILSSTKLMATMSSTYFLFIGRLSSSLKGYNLLEQTSIMRLINTLTQTSMLASSPAEVYVRLIISCFDYTKEFNGSRKLLEKFLFHHPEENVRLYATNFLRVLLRANVSDYSSWAIELLTKQLSNPSRVIHNAAADILDEACDLDENLEGLIGLKQTTNPLTLEIIYTLDVLRSTGDTGILLLSRFASSPNGLRYLIETPRQRLKSPLDSMLNKSPETSNDNETSQSQPSESRNSESSSRSEGQNGPHLISEGAVAGGIVNIESEFDVELARWRNEFNYRYVKLVEDVLNDSLTYHQKGDDGKYGRRVDKINPKTKNSHLPPHLFGQLALNPDGIEIILSRKLMEPIYENLRNPPSDLEYSEVSLLKFKVSLWILGHVGSTDLGFQALENSRELIKILTDIAKTATVLSLRGTVFYVLGLLGSTEDGAEELRKCNWISQSCNRVALPLYLDLILSKPQDPKSSTTEDLASQANQTECEAQKKLDIGAKPGEVDEEQQDEEDGKQQQIVNEAPAVDPKTISIPSPVPLPIHPKLRECLQVEELEEIRREILKYVTNLSCCVATRPTENSLLDLKEKYDKVFEYDLGLYCEVCNQLAKHNFRLHARRFLQELFQDIIKIQQRF